MYVNRRVLFSFTAPPVIVTFSQPVSLVYNCQTRNRNVKSNFHELDRSFNTNKHSRNKNIFDWDGNGKLNRRRAISSKNEAYIKQQKFIPPSATMPTKRLNVSYVNSLFINYLLVFHNVVTDDSLLV